MHEYYIYIISTPSLLQLLLCPIPSQTHDLFFITVTHTCVSQKVVQPTYSILYCSSLCIAIHFCLCACLHACVHVFMSQHWDWITYQSFSLKKNKLFSHQPCIVGNSSFMGGACIVSPVSVYIKDV